MTIDTIYLEVYYSFQTDYSLDYFYFYFYFIRCSIYTDDYTSARTDKINYILKINIKYNMYIHCTEKRGDLEFVTLDQSFKLIQGLAWHNNAGW